MSNGNSHLKRVLFVAPRLEARGTSEYTLNLAEEFTKRGIEVLVACVSGPMLNAFKGAGIPVATFDRLESSLFALTDRGRFRDAITDFDPQVVHLQSVRVGRALGVANKFTDAPTLLTVHWKPEHRRNFRKLSENVQGVIATSQAVRQQIVQDCRVAEEKVSVIHNGLNLERIETHPIFCSSEPVIGCIGPVEDQRGQEWFVRAAARLLDAGKPAQFVIAGEGEEQSRIRKLVRKLGLQGHFTFVGGFSRYEEVLDALDVVVQSSLVDISGYSILEAMGHGRPVIAFDTGTAREIMQDHRTGRVVERGNVEQLADAIGEIIERTDLAREMGRRARARVSENFNVKTIARETSGLYHRLLQDMRRDEVSNE